MNPTQHLQTIIIGGGVAGLACAVDLVHAPQKVLVIEAQRELGGRFAAEKQLIDEFIHFIEGHGGEIVTDTRVHALELKTDKNICWVKTEWGTIKAHNTIVTLSPSEQTKLKLPTNVPGLFRLQEDFDNLQAATLAGQTLADTVLANNSK